MKSQIPFALKLGNAAGVPSPRTSPAERSAHIRYQKKKFHWPSSEKCLKRRHDKRGFLKVIWGFSMFRVTFFSRFVTAFVIAAINIPSAHAGLIGSIGFVPSGNTKLNTGAGTSLLGASTVTLPKTELINIIPDTVTINGVTSNNDFSPDTGSGDFPVNGFDKVTIIQLLNLPSTNLQDGVLRAPTQDLTNVLQFTTDGPVGHTFNFSANQISFKQSTIGNSSFIDVQMTGILHDTTTTNPVADQFGAESISFNQTGTGAVNEAFSFVTYSNNPGKVSGSIIAPVPEPSSLISIAIGFSAITIPVLRSRFFRRKTITEN